jgi:hypothetical protein
MGPLRNLTTHHAIGLSPFKQPREYTADFLKKSKGRIPLAVFAVGVMFLRAPEKMAEKGEKIEGRFDASLAAISGIERSIVA